MLAGNPFVSMAPTQASPVALSPHTVTWPNGEATTYTITQVALPTTAPIQPTSVVTSHYDDGMPVVPIAATSAYTQSTAAATPTQASIGGIFKPGPTSTHGIWYRQPWTIPAAWLLCVYSLFSVLMIAYLLFTGKMDLRGTLYFDSSVSTPARRAALRGRSGLYRVRSPDPHREWLRYLEQRDRAEARAHAAQEQQRLRGSNLSVVETHISYGEDEEDRQHQEQDLLHALNLDHGEDIEMQPYPQDVRRSSGEEYIRYIVRHRADSSRAVRMSVEDVGPTPATLDTAHIRQVLGDEDYEEQLHAWRLHELGRLQSSMERAGWM